MKNNHKRPRKQMRARNKDRVNRLRKQQPVFLSAPLFIMAVITLNLNELTTPEKLLARLRMHIEKLTGNAHFPTTDPTVAVQQIFADELEALIDAVNAGNNALIPDREAKVADGEEMIRQLSYNIQYLSKGDEVKIKSAGYDVHKAQGATQQPGRVLDLVAKPVGPGKIKLRWVREVNSRLYVIEQLGGGNPGIWDTAGKTRNVSFVVENLNPGQIYIFRVYGTNGNEDGNPSDPAEQRSL